MKQIGYKDDKELFDDLNSPSQTMAKVFHYMLTRQTNFVTLPWETSSHHSGSNNKTAENLPDKQQDDNSINSEVKKLSPNVEDLDKHPFLPTFGSVHSLAQKTDWAIGDSVKISYEKEEAISHIHAKVAFVMTSVQKLLTEIGFDWFHSDDWTIISRKEHRWG